ncbi:apolipoprotein N-acyltransferase [Cryobacterium psychrophilum]|uniref:apolipoprotein N-acyltransferase n=1 Tax=Cryobacterium psychrophilum TaxID=41988 RepID=UPI001F541A4E|nr:apolipoprotein N-acyltransferase [Cryobacterium psychrophilum]
MLTQIEHDRTIALPQLPSPKVTDQRNGLPLWIATGVAGVGGVLNALAFPGLGWWPLIFVGTPLIFLALVGRRGWGALAVGVLGGFAFWGTHILWITIYLGPVPWLALAGLQSIFFALGCAIMAFAWRFADRAFAGPWGRLGLTPVVIAGLWTLREYVTSNWPYGGFSWGRLAFSQSESPFGELVAWVGISGLSFLLAWISALIVQVAREPVARKRVIRSMAPVGLIALMLSIPAFPVVTSGTIRVAAVQGNADAALFAEYTPGQILQDHVAATEPLYGRTVDLVVWPENASDLNPLERSESAALLNRVSKEMNAPIVTGTITTDGSRTFNSLLLWKGGDNAVDQYDKIHPVPFAEYIPDREFWSPLAPDLFALIPRDFTIGTRDNVFDINGVTAGLAICFDIVDDNLIRQMIAGGADIILAPTNNADFGRTDQSVQQLAIARLRAIETGRSLVNTSTVGTSAIIAPDGGTIDRLPTFEPGAMVQDVPLSQTVTLAMVAGRGIELAVSGLGLVGMILAVLLARRRRDV